VEGASTRRMDELESLYRAVIFSWNCEIIVFWETDSSNDTEERIMEGQLGRPRG
jgi:hypothetical protein